MKAWQHILLGILLGLLFAGIILLFILPNRGKPIELVTLSAASSPAAPTESSLIKVELAGEVNQPGIYDLQEGAHLVDALSLAGGLTAEADPSRLNQAQVLKDGQKIFVPALGSASEPPAFFLTGTENLVNINAASLEDLIALRMIGELKAKAILAYREEHGAFQSLEELMEVPGIGESIFNSIKDQISLGP